jgi:thiamine-phosphate pyrophosphorylase
MADTCILCYITDRAAFPGDESTRRSRLLDKIAEATAAGIDYIQLREKDLSARDLESLARQTIRIIGELTTDHGPLATTLLINSRTDVALAVDANGVHLPANDISIAEVKSIWTKCGAGAPARVSPGKPVISVSCHSPEDVDEAAANEASIALFAPVFEKKDVAGTVPVGLESLRQACRSKIPVLALGGITLQNATSCLEAGAAGIAAIRLFQENDIAEVARSLRGC